MRIRLYYFSGTGNTAWVVDRLVEQLTQLGDEVTARSCEQVAAAGVDVEACDLLGVAFPVHTSLAPSLFRDFIAALPPAAGKPLFALTTAGYVAGDTAWHEVGPLRAKGYEPFLLANVVVANNLRLPLLSPLPIASEKAMARRLRRASVKVARLARRIHRQERYVEGAGPFGRLLGVTQRLSVGPFETLAFRGFYADERCTKCGWCAKHCPVENIELRAAGVTFLDHCMLCMRCYSFCPQQAIQSTARTRNVRRYPRYPGPEGRPYPRTP